MAKFLVRTPVTITTRVRRDASTLHAALREATAVTKMFGAAVVEEGISGNALAHCHISARLGVGPRSPRDARTFADCKLGARAKKILARERKRKGRR